MVEKEIKPKVSVVVPNWNRRDDIQLCLESIFNQDYENFEVIVIDNGSSDGSAEMVIKKFPKTILIKNKKNLGASIAKNQGIIKSKGEYILFCDSDIEMMHNSCIKNMVNLLKENQDIGAIGGEAYKLPSGKIETKKKMITFNCETNNIIMNKEEYFLENCGYVPTCNCMVPKQLVYDCGGFDSNLIVYGEDKEMGIKIKNKGYRNVIDSRCLAFHYISQKTEKRSLFMLNKNRIKVVLKNYGFLKIISLPILDIISLFNPKKIKDLKDEKIDVTKWSKSKNKSRNKLLIIKTLSFGGKYLISLGGAYIWNFFYLPKTISERIKRVNYLEESNENNQI